LRVARRGEKKGRKRKNDFTLRVEAGRGRGGPWFIGKEADAAEAGLRKGKKIQPPIFPWAANLGEGEGLGEI